jgi:hypothetical protein
MAKLRDVEAENGVHTWPLDDSEFENWRDDIKKGEDHFLYCVHHAVADMVYNMGLRGADALHNILGTVAFPYANKRRLTIEELNRVANDLYRKYDAAFDEWLSTGSREVFVTVKLSPDGSAMAIRMMRRGEQ